jgi:hypothetical protein
MASIHLVFECTHLLTHLSRPALTLHNHKIKPNLHCGTGDSLFFGLFVYKTSQVVPEHKVIVFMRLQVKSGLNKQAGFSL